MNHITKSIFLFAALFLISAISINAQHKMNHSQKDTTKQMMHHTMKNDSTKMHHMKVDESKLMEVKNIWNAFCPVKGGEVDPETPTVQYKGKTIGFCCPGCDSKFMAEPEKYIKNLSEDGKKYIGKNK